MADISISTELNPSPLVKIFATKFRKAIHQPGYCQQLAKARGTFALKSSKDPQAITITISANNVHLVSGVVPHADIVISLDFDNPDAAPKVTNLWRHPLYAMAIGKLLEFQSPHWIDAMKRFWEQHHDFPGMPSGIKVHCEDEDRDFTIGSESHEMLLTGKAEDIAEVFSGDAVLFESLSKQKLKGQFNFQHAVVISDVTLHMMLGDI